MKPRAAVIAALSLAAATSSAAAAPDVAELGSWLDADAAAVLKLEPAQLETMAAIARKTGGDYKSAAAVASMVSRGGLGFDATDATAWTDSGIGSPILIQLSAVDRSAADTIYDALSKTRSWNAKTYRSLTKTYLRGRLAIPVTDMRRARSTLASIRALPQLYAVDAANAADIALLFGASPKNASALVAWLDKRGAFLVGWLDGMDALIVARQASKRIIVIDVLASYAGVPITWDRDKARLGKLLSRGGKGGFAKSVGRGAGPQLSAPGTALWLSPRGVADLGRALAQLAHLRAIAAGNGGDRAPATAHVCAGFRELADSGAFSDAVFRLSFEHNRLDLAAAWGLRSSFGLANALATVDRRLPSPALVSGASAAGTLYLRGTKKLRKLPRPDAMTGSWEKLWASVDRCRAGAATLTALFAWPQVAGLFLDELAAIDSTAEDTVSGFGGAAVAVTRLSWRSEYMAGAGEISFDAAGAAAMESFADAVFGARKTHRKPIPHVTWGNGAIRPFSYASGKRRVVGAGFGGVKVAWRLAHAPGKRMKSPPLARAAIAISRALDDLGAGDLGRALASRYGKTLRVVAEVRGGVLTLAARAARQ